MMRYIDLSEMPSLLEAAADWFHSKWGVPKEAYQACMEAYLRNETQYGWYLCMDGEKIVAGLGVIENDFHDRKDLSPNVCAVYTEEAYRGRGIAGKLLDTESLPRNGYYAFVCEKCAPVFGYYGFLQTEQELNRRAREIHNRV